MSEPSAGPESEGVMKDLLARIEAAMKKSLCWLGCHSRYGRGYESAEDYVGFNAKMQCRWCGKIGLVDSQNNLF